MSKSISVIIPAYNGERYIVETIESVRSQDFDGDVEIIVVDDGSSDSTAALVADCAGVRLHRQVNAGQWSARNVGFSLSRGEYVVFFDQDDLLVQGCLRINAHLLDEHPHLDAVAGRSVSFARDSDLAGLPGPTTASLNRRHWNSAPTGTLFAATGLSRRRWACFDGPL